LVQSKQIELQAEVLSFHRRLKYQMMKCLFCLCQIKSEESFSQKEKQRVNLMDILSGKVDKSLAPSSVCSANSLK